MIHRSPHADVQIPEQSLPAFILERAHQCGDRAAIIDAASGRTLTFAELSARVRAMAAGLQKRGFQKGDVCALFLPNIPEFAVVFYGAALAGMVNTTINPTYTAEEIRAQLDDSRARCIFTVGPLLERARAAAGDREVFVVGEPSFAELFADPTGFVAPTIDPRKDLVALPYSSGTTGLPKGVMRTHLSMVANCCQMVPVEPIGETDTAIAVLPFYHIYGMGVMLSYCLSAGTTIVTMPRFDLEQFLSALEKYRVTRVYVVPFILLALARHPMVDRFDLSSIRSICTGAAPQDPETMRACEERLGCVVRQGFGMTEIGAVTHANLEQGNRHASAGPCIPNTEWKIVDGEGRALDPGELGEVWVRGPQAMAGYLNQPAMSALTLDADGWLHTGDLATATADGYLQIVDRLKELIKYKGLQVAPAELEAMLLTHPQIADVAVIPSPDEEAGEVPKAFVVLRPEAKLTSQDVIDYVAERVAPHKKVRRVAFVDQVPRSLSGKLLRRILVEQERAVPAT